jgi:hypothetical protein
MRTKLLFFLALMFAAVTGIAQTTNSLQKFAGTQVVVITPTNAPAHNQNLRDDLRKYLATAKWVSHTNSEALLGPLNQNLRGVVVWDVRSTDRNDVSCRNAGIALVEALKQAGIVAQFADFPRPVNEFFRAGVVVVWVGLP